MTTFNDFAQFFKPAEKKPPIAPQPLKSAPPPTPVAAAKVVPAVAKRPAPDSTLAALPPPKHKVQPPPPDEYGDESSGSDSDADSSGDEDDDDPADLMAELAKNPEVARAANVLKGRPKRKAGVAAAKFIERHREAGFGMEADTLEKSNTAARRQVALTARRIVTTPVDAAPDLMHLNEYLAYSKGPACEPRKHHTSGSNVRAFILALCEIRDTLASVLVGKGERLKCIPGQVSVLAKISRNVNGEIKTEPSQNPKTRLCAYSRCQLLPATSPMAITLHPKTDVGEMPRERIYVTKEACEKILDLNTFWFFSDVLLNASIPILAGIKPKATHEETLAAQMAALDPPWAEAAKRYAAGRAEAVAILAKTYEDFIDDERIPIPPPPPSSIVPTPAPAPSASATVIDGQVPVGI
jgi:hypothetical protein